MKNSIAPMTLRSRSAGGGRWEYGSWPWLWEGLGLNKDPKESQCESRGESIPKGSSGSSQPLGGGACTGLHLIEKSRDALSQVHCFLRIQASVYDHTETLGHIATPRRSCGKLLCVIWGLCSLWFYSKNCTFLFSSLYSGGWWWWYLVDSHGQLLDS